MKIKIISNTQIKKKDLVPFVKNIPVSWGIEVGSLVIYASGTRAFIFSFHRPKRELGIRIPPDFPGEIDNILGEIAVALQVIRDYGHIPQTVPKEKITLYQQEWFRLIEHI